MIFTKHVIKSFISVVMVVGMSSAVLVGSDASFGFASVWNREKATLTKSLTNKIISETAVSQVEFLQAKKFLDDAIRFIAEKIAKDGNFVSNMIGRSFNWSGSVMTPLHEAFTKLSAIRCQSNVAVALAETEKSLRDLEAALRASGGIMMVVRYTDPTKEESFKKPRNQEEAMARLAQLNPELQELLPYLKTAQQDASRATQRRDMHATTVAASLEGQLRLYETVCEAQRILGEADLLVKK